MVPAMIAIKDIAKHVKVTQRVPSKVPIAYAPATAFINSDVGINGVPPAYTPARDYQI